MTACFFQKLHFCLYFDQKDPKIGQFVSLIEIFVILFSVKQSKSEIIMILDIPSPIGWLVKF